MASYNFTFDTPENTESPRGVISDELRSIFEIINYVFICQFIDIIGTVTNIINIIVFLNQGLSDSVTISLLALAISDLISLTTLLWHNIVFIPWLHDLSFFKTVQIQYLTAGWPHVISARISAWVTSFITLERCICIIWPLKVKLYITPKRTTIFMVSLFIVLIASATPVYYTTRLGWTFYPKYNRTLLGTVFIEAAERTRIESASFAVNNLFIFSSAFLSVVTCTCILVIKLRQKAKWRILHSSVVNKVPEGGNVSNKASNSASRDQSVARMVVLISTIFIICFIPQVVIFVTCIIEPRFSFDGVFRNEYMVIFSVSFITESLNASVNAFIYYKMSSRYRQTLARLFRRSHGR